MQQALLADIVLARLTLQAPVIPVTRRIEVISFHCGILRRLPMGAIRDRRCAAGREPCTKIKATCSLDQHSSYLVLCSLSAHEGC